MFSLFSRSPELRTGGLRPKYSLSISSISTWVYPLVGPTILTFSLIFLSVFNVTVSLAANCPG